MNTSNRYPLVSVLTTVYNGIEYLPQAIESILTQTYRNFEYVIVDDGSVDGTREYLLSLHDKRIKVILIERSGRGIALNKGVAMCTGEYIAILDADDVAIPYRIEYQVRVMKSSQFAVIGGRCAVDIEDYGVSLSSPHNPECMKVRVINPKSYIDKNPLPHSSVMIRRSLLKEIGGYDYKRKDLFDYDLWIRMSKMGYSIAMMDSILIYKRIHSRQHFENKKRTQYLKAGFILRMKSWAIFSKNPCLLYKPFLYFMYGMLIPREIRKKIFKYSNVLAGRGRGDYR